VKFKVEMKHYGKTRMLLHQ